MAEWQTRVPQEHVGIARAGSSPAAPTKTVNQAIRTGGLFMSKSAPHGARRCPVRGGNGGSMAQETTPAETDPIDPAQGGEIGQEPDYKALYENALKELRKDPRTRTQHRPLHDASWLVSAADAP